MNAELLSGIVAIALSLGFSYIPGLKDLFEKLSGDYKRMVMGIALVVAAGAIFGLSCANVVDSVVCSKDGILGLLSILLEALVANQAMFLMTPKGK
jgi:hypothetical protein